MQNKVVALPIYADVGLGLCLTELGPAADRLHRRTSLRVKGHSVVTCPEMLIHSDII